jgi:predicted nucleotidyltransferase
MHGCRVLLRRDETGRTGVFVEKEFSSNEHFGLVLKKSLQSKIQRFVEEED